MVRIDPPYGYMNRVHPESGRATVDSAIRFTVQGEHPRILAIVRQPAARDEPQWTKQQERAFIAYVKRIHWHAATINHLPPQAIRWAWDKPPAKPVFRYLTGIEKG